MDRNEIACLYKVAYLATIKAGYDLRDDWRVFVKACETELGKKLEIVENEELMDRVIIDAVEKAVREIDARAISDRYDAITLSSNYADAFMLEKAKKESEARTTLYCADDDAIAAIDAGVDEMPGAASCDDELEELPHYDIADRLPCHFDGDMF